MGRKTTVQVVVQDQNLQEFGVLDKRAKEFEREMRNQFLSVYFGSDWEADGGAAQKIQTTLDDIGKNREVAARYVKKRGGEVQTGDVDALQKLFQGNSELYQKVVDTIARSRVTLLEHEAMRLLPGYVRPPKTPGKGRMVMQFHWRLDAESRSQPKPAIEPG